jgi:hypothetical protein
MGEAKRKKANQTPVEKIQWGLTFVKNFKSNDQVKDLELYWISYEFDGDGIGLSVPLGRRDIARFIMDAINEKVERDGL